MEKVRSVKIDGRTFNLPFIDEIPFDEQQDAELGESIKEAGRVEVPIIVWKERRTSDSETVVDGAHRAIHASHLNLPVPIQQRSFKTEARALEYVYLVNYRRRQLSIKQLEDERKDRIERVAEARQQGKSIRQIAEDESKSKSQIERDLKDAEVTVPPGTVNPPSGKIQGRDGRQQPAKKPLVEIDLRCDRCKRLNLHNETCASCKATKAEYIAKQGRKRGQKAGKNGQVMVQWKDLENAYGKLVRLGDDIMKQHGLFNSPVYHGLKRVLQETLTGIKAAEKEAKRITKEKARK